MHGSQLSYIWLTLLVVVVNDVFILFTSDLIKLHFHVIYICKHTIYLQTAH